ncbi:hypothetical protein B0T18DRAFT_431643 [Schizothecium vesticola]|uniref:Mitochondrial carrier protein pet8 n=1 Tax=Schizothecium vesticola TaxID=314040 RepID=A0AA40EJB0_9PEZI|nr:hypothetical protein B0T18DRAFT_431643 [Schizothecium vesticola]
MSSPARLLLRQSLPRATITTTTTHRARPLSTTPLLRLKESDHPSPEAYEKHKQDSIAKQKQGKGHWKAELASNSEESIKADRHATSEGLTEASIKRLQEETKGRAEETRKHGTSMKDM